MLCVYSHLITFHELYGFVSQGKCGVVCKTVIRRVKTATIGNLQKSPFHVGKYSKGFHINDSNH